MSPQPHVTHPHLTERGHHAPPSRKHHRLGPHDRLAVILTKKFGTMWMFYVLIVWMLSWMFLASIKFWLFREDPYPFTFLLFLSNLVQLFALPILAVGQQILSRASDKQAEQTYKDAEIILQIQDEIHRLVKINNELTKEIHAITLKK